MSKSAGLITTQVYDRIVDRLNEPPARYLEAVPVTR